MSLSLSSHFNRWRWWINLLLISGWILHFCCKMPNGKILGSESDNTETHFHGDINVLAMKLMMCFFSSDKVLMFWWRTADYLKCYLWNVWLFCMNPTAVNQTILSSCLVCNFHIIVSMLCKAEKSYIQSSFFYSVHHCVGEATQRSRWSDYAIIVGCDYHVDTCFTCISKMTLHRNNSSVFYDLTHACLLLWRMMNLTDLFGPFLFSRLHNCEWFRGNQGPASSRQ